MCELNEWGLPENQTIKLGDHLVGGGRHDITKPCQSACGCKGGKNKYRNKGRVTNVSELSSLLL